MTTTPDRAPASTHPAPAIGKVVLASFIGTAIEWYDFFLYGTAAALVFGPLFFPELAPGASRLASLATFSAGFVARPLGAVIFGHFGDRMGRKTTLVTSLMLMGMATFLIGLLPTYSQIGYWAPVLLVILRCVQGVGVGGEWGGAVLMAVEHGHAGRRGFYASWVQVGVPAGMVLSNGAFIACQYLSPENFMAWGWRLPFLAGMALMGVGLYIRLNIVESELFKAAKTQRAAKPSAPPLLVVLKTQWREVLLAMGAKLVENTAFYLYAIFVPSYAASLGYKSSTVLSTILIASGIQFLTIPLAGRLSDTFGRRPVYLAGSVGTGLFAFAFFALVHTGQYPCLLLAMIVALGILHAMMYGPQAAFLSELFRTEVRYSGASLGYQLASVVAGGLAPLVALSLRERFDGAWWPVAVYLTVCSAITCGAVLLASETSRKDICG